MEMSLQTLILRSLFIRMSELGLFQGSLMEMKLKMVDSQVFLKLKLKMNLLMKEKITTTNLQY